MSTDTASWLQDIKEKLEVKFGGVTQKQQELVDRIDLKIKETQEIQEYHSVYQSLPLSMTCR
jgi:hypothetical protein